MNFNNINYFLAIVEEGSISSAARKLFISQQALSEQLKKLEGEIGTPLFKRSKNKLILTPAGKCFLNGSKQLVNDYESIILDIKTIDSIRYNSISIGFPTYGCQPYIIDFINKFMVDFPQYRLNIAKRQHLDIGKNIEGVDIYFSALPLSNDIYNHIILDNDPYCVMFRKSLAEKIYGDRMESKLSELRLSGDLSVIKDMPFSIVLNRYGEMATDLKEIFVENSFQPRIGITTENISFCDISALNGTCVMLATGSHLMSVINNQAGDINDVVYFPIRVESFKCQLALSYPKGIKLHPAEVTLIEEFKKYAEEKLVLR